MAKKPKIPQAARREACIRLGAIPGREVQIKCAYCDSLGFARWPLTLKGKPSGWVMIGGLELDHIVAIHRGGANTADNLTLACRSCNRRKSHKTLDDWRQSVGAH